MHKAYGCDLYRCFFCFEQSLLTNFNAVIITGKKGNARLTT